MPASTQKQLPFTISLPHEVQNVMLHSMNKHNFLQITLILLESGLKNGLRAKVS